jgi:uncharacterized membrane protein
VSEETPMLPEHIEQTIRSIADIHAQHHHKASTSQRWIAGLTKRLGRPEFVAIITGAIAAWIAINSALSALHVAPFDPAPFYWLQGIIAMTALYMTALILITQRHENELAEHRAQLTLEVTIVSEQKIAKLIELLEQQRRDNPLMRNTFDPEAAAMAQPADHEAMLSATKITNRGGSDDGTIHG